MRLRGRFEAAAPGVRWASRTNLHFTLRFLGEIPESGIPDLSRAASAAAGAVSPFKLRIQGTGVFPFSGPPGIAWLGAGDGAAELCGLARKLDDELFKAGFGRRDKPFRPHLTIGRIPDGQGDKGLRQIIQSEAGFASPVWAVQDFALVRSVLGPRGAEYTDIRRFLLSG